ncbi:MAG TPA: hypothetical protein VFE47_22020 [Tepidisphaeraceae bacterium]|nr:hypothetical protein [Tepidisphaeraceae bacterium]
MNQTILEASKYIDPTGGLVASAVLLAETAIAQLDKVDMVVIDLVGLRSVSSSYFNTLLTQIAQKRGTTTLQHRVEMRFSAAAQKAIFDSSYRAVIQSLSL